MSLFLSQFFDGTLDKFNLSFVHKLLKFTAHKLFNIGIIDSINFYCSCLDCKQTQQSSSTAKIQDYFTFARFVYGFCVLFHSYLIIKHFYVDIRFAVARKITFVYLPDLSFKRGWITILHDKSLLPFCFRLLLALDKFFFLLIYT